MTDLASISMLQAAAGAGGSTEWNGDISTATYIQTFSTASQETGLQGIFFKPDGTKFYIVGDNSDTLHQYDLSTAWDISTASFVQSLSLSAKDTYPSGIFFHPDGNKMYFTGRGNNVHEYDLSTNWDISTASFLQSFSVSAQSSDTMGLFISPDGTKMYVVSRATDKAYEYDLSTAWDVSSASYASREATGANDLTDLFFSFDGLKMYLCISGFSGASKVINEYDLSSAWNISTASFLQSFNYGAQSAAARGFCFDAYGTKMYIVNVSSVNQYDLS